jgi:hypothetical protein
MCAHFHRNKVSFRFRKQLQQPEHRILQPQADLPSPFRLQTFETTFEFSRSSLSYYTSSLNGLPSICPPPGQMSSATRVDDEDISDVVPSSKITNRGHQECSRSALFEAHRHAPRTSLSSNNVPLQPGLLAASAKPSKVSHGQFQHQNSPSR